MFKKTICSIIKDEQLYLKEWIDWHLSIGFDAIHLFEDMGSKSHEDIVKDYPNVYLRRYETDEEVKWLLVNDGTTIKQEVLYRYFAENYKHVYDWCAFIDIDEYIILDESYNLDKLCNEFADCPSIHLSWKMIGASGHVKRPKDGIMKSYLNYNEEICSRIGIYNVKSFVNLKKFKGLKSLHHSCGGVDANFNVADSNVVYKKAWINHYFTKSWEDWCDRIFKRGDILHGHRRLYDFFEYNEDMNHLKNELIASVSILKPINTYFIDREKGLITGGNTHRIKELNLKRKRQKED